MTVHLHWSPGIFFTFNSHWQAQIQFVPKHVDNIISYFVYSQVYMYCETHFVILPPYITTVYSKSSNQYAVEVWAFWFKPRNLTQTLHLLLRNYNPFKCGPSILRSKKQKVIEETKNLCSQCQKPRSHQCH